MLSDRKRYKEATGAEGGEARVPRGVAGWGRKHERGQAQSELTTRV